MDKKFFKLLISGLLAICFTYCNKDMPDIPTVTDSKNECPNHHVSLEKALERSCIFQSSLYKESATRSNDDLRIESVDYISMDSPTRSTPSDTLFYLVNYENNKGFMLLSADDRLLPVYAMSDEGKLDLNDTIVNGGLRLFMRMAKADAINISTQATFPGTLEPDPFDYKYDRTISPKLSSNIRQLNQTPPFNKYCFTPEGEQALVGCVPLATATIVTYYNKYVQFNDISLDWESINKDVHNENFYKFLGILGGKSYLNVSYGTNATYGNSKDVPKILQRLGLNTSELISFNDIEVAKALENGPIFVRANGIPSSHAWVMDGYMRFGDFHRVDLAPEPGRVAPYFFFHCVWGSGGYSDGYYYYSSTGKIDGNADYYDKDDSRKGEPMHFYSLSWVKIIL